MAKTLRKRKIAKAYGLKLKVKRNRIIGALAYILYVRRDGRTHTTGAFIYPDTTSLHNEIMFYRAVQRIRFRTDTSYKPIKALHIGGN